MGQMIDALLAFARLGRTPLAKQSVNLDALVSEARQQLAPESTNRRIQWVVPPLGSVSADPALLRVVITNLLSNAIKYTRERAEARIEIVCQQEPDEVVFGIRDNGAGFDMRYVDKLFGVFQRLHSAEQFEGSGIGLASVKRIIDRHHGRTWAESVLNEGATFYFSLPGMIHGHNARSLPATSTRAGAPAA